MLETERIRLRRWREADREPFAALNADPLVMEHFPGPLTREESDAMIARIEAGIEERGFGFLAAEERQTGAFLGFIGLSSPRFEAPFTPCVEIGWRLARSGWGRGLATEGARAALAWGFEELGLDEIVAFTVPENVRSRRVMEKLGMTHDPGDDFEHPSFPDGDGLRRCVLYRAASPRV